MTPRDGAVKGREESRHGLWSVRTLLVCLVLACLLPGVLGAVALLAGEYQEGRKQLQQGTIQTARALVQAVDNQIQRVQALAQGLAGTEALAREDFAVLYREAREVLARTDPESVASLVDAGGRQIINTATEFGLPLPNHGSPELIQKVFSSGQPAVSDLFIARVSGRPVTNVAVPVFIRDKVAYVMTISVPPEKFSSILDAQGLPTGWVATILDGTSTIVARSRESDKYAGGKPAPAFLEKRGAAAEGALEFVMKDGVSVLSVFTRSPSSNWTVAVNIPQESLEGALDRRITLLALAIGALFAVSIVLAWLAGGRIVRSFLALRAPALALGAGEVLPLPAVEVKEASEVTQALGEAAGLLQQRTAALRQTEIRLQTLTEHAPAAIAIFDREMRYLAVSRRWCQDFRLDQANLLGRSHYEVFPDLPARWKEAHARGLAGEVLCELTDCFELNEGLVQWGHWELWPWYDDKGEVGGIVIASEDITERRKAEIRLKESEEKYRTLFTNMTEGFALGEPILDEQGKAVDFRFLEVNDAFYVETGLTPDILGQAVGEYLPGLEQSWIDIYGEVALTGCSRRFQNYSSGTRRHYDNHAFCPAPGYFAVLGRDITRQKGVELALQESESRFRLMANCAPVMIWLADTDRNCHWFNESWLAFTGRTMEQEINIGWAEGVHPDDRERCVRTYEEAFDRRGNFSMEYRLRRHDGQYRWVIDQGVPRFDAQGAFAGYVGACIDITDMKAAREGMEQANADLERRVQERTAELLAANRELESFTFATSHDLKGPLQRISNFSRLLETRYREKLEGDGLLFLDILRQNATRLSQLVDDLLRHARIAQQALELKPVDVLTRVLVVLEESAEDIREARAEVRVDVPPVRVLADPQPLTQALANLVQNALKYSVGANPPVIDIGGEERGDRLLLWVRDNGIGFDMAYHDKIFQIFSRLHTYSEYEGSGVGLALVKRAMERVGGRVWAESRPGQGATFFLELRLVAEAEAVPA